MSSERIQAQRFLGRFRELKHGRPEGSSLRAAVRDHGSEYETSLVRYLRGGAVLAASGSGVHDVLSPGHEFIGGLDLLTDGQWFWYSDLAHYVERYHVAVGDEFLMWVRRQNWTPPELTDADLLRIEEAFLRCT